MSLGAVVGEKRDSKRSQPGPSPQLKAPLTREEAASNWNRRPLALLFFGLAIVAAAYSAAPLGGFVWDDHLLIVEEPSIRQIQPLSSYFDRMFLGGPAGAPSRGFYRPLVVLSFAVDWQLWGGAPLGFHLTNLLLHLCAVVFVFLLARRWGAEAVAAAAAAALFGVLPRLSEAVAWISGRTDLLAVVFVLLALVLHGFENRRRWLAAFALFLGLLSKEVAAAGLIALALLEWRDAKAAGEQLKGAVLRLLPLAAAGGGYAILRILATFSAAAPSLAPKLGVLRRLAVAVEAIGHYAWMWFDPLRPRTQIGSVWVMNPKIFGLGLVLLLLIGLASYRWWRRLDARSLAVVVLVAIPLGLVLHLLPVALQVVSADRFLYLPAAALAVAGACWVSAVSLRGRVGVGIGVAIALPLFAGATYVRTLDWQDDLSLWEEAALHAPPGNSLPFVQLGIALTRAGRPEAALPVLERSIAIDDQLYETAGVGDGLGSGSRDAMALALAAMGRFEEASRLYERLAKGRGDDPVHAFNLAVVRGMALDFQGAKRALGGVLDRFPDYQIAREHLDKIELAERKWASLPPQENHEGAAVTMERAEVFDLIGRAGEARELWRSVAESEVAPNVLRFEASSRLEALGGR